MKREGPFFFKEKRGEHIKVGRTSQSLFVRACASYTHTHTHLYTSIGHAAAEFFLSLSLYSNVNSLSILCTEHYYIYKLYPCRCNIVHGAAVAQGIEFTRANAGYIYLYSVRIYITWPFFFSLLSLQGVTSKLIFYCISLG